MAHTGPVQPREQQIQDFCKSCCSSGLSYGAARMEAWNAWWASLPLIREALPKHKAYPEDIRACEKDPTPQTLCELPPKSGLPL